MRIFQFHLVLRKILNGRYEGQKRDRKISFGETVVQIVENNGTIEIHQAVVCSSVTWCVRFGAARSGGMVYIIKIATARIAP